MAVNPDKGVSAKLLEDNKPPPPYFFLLKKKLIYKGCF